MSGGVPQFRSSQFYRNGEWMASEQDYQRLRNELQEAKAGLMELNKVFEQLMEPPAQYGVVLSTNKDSVTVSFGGGISELALMPAAKGVKPGEGVLVNVKTGHVSQRSHGLVESETVSVTKVLPGNRIEVGVGGQERVIVLHPKLTGVQEGDKVALDPTGRVAFTRVEAMKEPYDFDSDTGVTWDSIGGQVEAKRQMIEAIELPMTHPEIFKFYGKKPIKGIALYGPPGCGKTMFGKAAASAVAKLGGGKKSAFMYVKGPEILDPFVGVAEAAVRGLFTRARKHKKEHGVPAVIFIDEADAILGKRGSRYAFMEKTIVPTFLAEMDGLEDSGAIVILATNRQDTLDPAVMREGRMDRKIKIARPTSEDAEMIFRIHLARPPLHKENPIEVAAQVARDAVFSEQKVMFNVITKDGKNHPLLLQHIVSGALIGGIVEQATSMAMHRDLKLKTKGGITKDDLIQSVHSVFDQNRDLDFSDNLSDIVGDREVLKVVRA